MAKVMKIAVEKIRVSTRQQKSGKTMQREVSCLVTVAMKALSLAVDSGLWLTISIDDKDDDDVAKYMLRVEEAQIGLDSNPTLWIHWIRSFFSGTRYTSTTTAFATGLLQVCCFRVPWSWFLWKIRLYC